MRSIHKTSRRNLIIHSRPRVDFSMHRTAQCVGKMWDGWTWMFGYVNSLNRVGNCYHSILTTLTLRIANPNRTLPLISDRGIYDLALTVLSALMITLFGLYPGKKYDFTSTGSSSFPFLFWLQVTVTLASGIIGAFISIRVFDRLMFLW